MKRTDSAAHEAPKITVAYAGKTYEVNLRGDALDPQRLEAAREIASACSGLHVRAGRPSPNMRQMVEFELSAALKRLADLVG